MLGKDVCERNASTGSEDLTIPNYFCQVSLLSRLSTAQECNTSTSVLLRSLKNVFAKVTVEARERCYGGDGKDEKGVSSPFFHHLLSHLRGTLDVNYKLSFWSISHLTSFYSGLILGFLFAGDVKINSATAHPHQTPDGSVINVTVTYGRISSYKIIQIPPSSGQAGVNALEGGRVLCTIPPLSLIHI